MKHSANLKRTFTSVMLELKQKSRKSVATICEEAEGRFGEIHVSSKTVEKWFDVKNGPSGPTDWASLLQVLSALTRDRAVVDELLRLSQLQKFNELSASNDLEKKVLNWWKKVFKGEEEEKTLVENPVRQESAIPPITAIPGNSYFSAHPNPLFMGRDQDLLEIANNLSEGRGVILVGLGGIGKTQLAIEFAHRYGHKFVGGVFMVSCIDNATATSQIAACGGSRGMRLFTEQTELSIEQRVVEVQNEWRQDIARLLIFDNVDAESSVDPEKWLLQELIPPTGACKIIVTSTKSEWSPLLPLRVKKLAGFRQSDAVDYLQRFVPDISNATAIRITEALDNHPLGIHVAASYLSKYQISVDPEEYATQLETDPVTDFDLSPSDPIVPTGHIASIARTFAFSYDKLTSSSDVKDRLALQLLTFAAYLSPGESIPMGMVKTYMDRELVNTRVRLESVLSRLSDIGLINSERHRIFVHRLVAMFVRKRTSWPDDVFEKLSPVVADASGKFTQGEHDTFLWQWLPHLLYLGQQAKAQIEKRSLYWLIELGGCLTALQYIAPARDLLLFSLEQHETYFSDLDQEYLALIHHKLGLNYSADHDFDKCYEHNVHAYEIRHALLAEQPDNDRLEREYAKTLNNLGYLFLRLGKLTEAEKNLDLSFEIKRKLNIPARATLNNLGLLKLLRNEENSPQLLDEALHLLNQAKTEGGYGTFLRLGVTYHLMGNYSDRDFCFEEAIKILHKRFPPLHHIPGDAFYNLGKIFINSKNKKAAAICFERAIGLLEKTEGKEGERLLRESHQELEKIRLTD
jgi:tetratricopeptide (TPR) repeat protein